MKNINLKSEKGFTIFEVILSLFIVSIAFLSCGHLLDSINKADNLTKETHYAKKLIDPYLSYYQGLEVKEKDLNVYLSDVSRVDLVKQSRDRDPASVPMSFKDLKVTCENYPYEIMEDKEDPLDKDVPEYLVFEITCEINNHKINKGRSFEIKKFINRD